ncbi:MAG: efflux RND transporter permease subunit [Acidobacteria bacterium]|nr:efflux RND transporter permease subunit [Acidobacteriota bacterium]
MTRAAIEKNRITTMALVIIIVGGFISYRNLPQDEDPGFTIRTATVVTYFPGASPERVENLVSDKLEEVIQEIPELDYMTSESRTGVSIIHVNIKESYMEMRPIWDNLRRKVEKAEAELPEGIVGPIVNDEFGDVFGILLSLTAEGYSYADVKDIADEVRDELLRLEDAAKVEIYGAQEERIFVEYNNARLAELKMSVYQLEQILESRNIIIPGGDILIGPERIVLEPSGNFETIEDLRRTVIKLPGRKEVVYLEDLADVYRGYIDPPLTKMRCNGIRCLGVGISMRKGGNIISLGVQVSETIRRLESLYPIGIEFELLADQAGRVDKKVSDFIGNLLQAILIVLLVMLITLGLRTGLVVASLIPAAMLMSFVVMSFVGVGLDQMSLAALIIALGMLIDNAIVMSESILVQMEAGKPAVQAAIDSGSELRVPLLTSSLTTAAAFLPIYLAKSTAGEYTGVIFVVVTITLLCSWVLSLTMTPLLCVKFLKPGKQDSQASFDSRFYRTYRNLLIHALRNRLLVLGGAVGVFALAIYTFGYLPILFFPKADNTFFSAQLELPLGIDIATTEAMVDQVEQYIKDDLLVSEDRPEGISSWVSFIGGGEPRYILTFSPDEPKPSFAYLLMNTSSYPIVATMIKKIEEFCQQHFPDVVATVRPADLGPPVEKPVQVRLSGRDPKILFGLADQVKAKLRSINGTRNIEDDWGRRTKKLLVQVNGARARRAGVTNLDIAVSLQSILSGIESTQFREDEDLIPVTLRSVAADRQDLGKLETLNIYSQTTGQAVPLKQVADIQIAWEPSKVLRRDRLKTVTVESDVVVGVTANEVNRQIIPWLDEQRAGWPVGYWYEMGGEIETSGKANVSIMAELPIAMMVIVLLLVSQFNSFRRPLIILMTIPLGIIGVVFGLLVTGSYFGFMTLLGIVSLSGIVINNAIVLLDRIRIEIEENGHTPQNAIIEAGQRRLRPILLTTVTTLGGLMPLWFGGGPMWEPMAIAIIFGLVVATVLTLGIVPLLYSLMFRVGFREFTYSPAAPTRS